MKYSEFISSKARSISCRGIDRLYGDYSMKQHQDALSKWALRRGRAAAALAMDEGEEK